jgi:hypothetical protein
MEQLDLLSDSVQGFLHGAKDAARINGGDATDDERRYDPQKVPLFRRECSLSSHFNGLLSVALSPMTVIFLRLNLQLCSMPFEEK